MPKVDPDVQARREARRARGGNTGISGGLDPSTPAGSPSGFGSSGGGGGLDRQSGLEKSMQTGEVIPPSHFNSRLEWQEYYASLPQEIKRGHKQRAGQRDRAINDYLSFGGDFNDLGIKNKKEEGQARYRRMGMHNLDKSFSYDWENGVKYPIATSDDNVYMKPIPLTADDYAEKAEIDKYGATPEGFARRMQDSTRNTLNTWSNANAGTGKITRGPDGRLRAIGENGQTIYFDDYGNALDSAGNPTGINYATGGWGSLPGVGVVPGGPGATPNTNDTGGNWAREVTTRRPDYGGWGNTYGPGTSGSGITLPPGATPPPTPVAPIQINQPTVSPTPRGFGAAPINMNQGMNAPMSSPGIQRPAAPISNAVRQPSVNPFSAPGSMPNTNRVNTNRRQPRIY